MNLSSYIDHTLLKPTATANDIQVLCKEAILHKFYAVCINGCYTKLCSTILGNSSVKIATVIGFPLGAMNNKIKVAEAVLAIEDGASEIDMVINIGQLKNNQLKDVAQEIYAVKKSIGNNLLKVIIETCFLTEEEKRYATHVVMDSGADYIKTSTGFGSGGATKEDIILFKSILKDTVKIKASGGIKDTTTAIEYIELGVTRIGTSSGIEIIKGIPSSKRY